MQFFFFSFILSTRQNDPMHPGPLPSFQPIPSSDIKANVTDIYQLTNNTFSSSGTERHYIQTTAHIISTDFLNCHSFGPNLFTASGGGASFENSEFVFKSCTFAGNQALFGGSISSFNSFLETLKCNFSNDVSYLNGGSILFLSNTTSDGSYRLSVAYYCFETDFDNCQCSEQGGAIAIADTDSFYIQKSYFMNCSAGHSAGAIMMKNCIASFFFSNFIECASGTKEKATYFGHQKSDRKLGIPKGGGAILAYLYSEAEESNPSNLYLQECCFAANRCVNGETGNAHGGFDLLLIGHVVFFTYRCAFTNSKEYAFQHSTRLPECNNKSLDCSYFEITNSEDHYNVKTSDFAYKCDFFSDNRTYDDITAFPETNTFAVPSPRPTETPSGSFTPTRSQIPTTKKIIISEIPFTHSPNNKKSRENMLPVVYIVGIAIGSVLVCIIFGLSIALCYFIKKKRNRNETIKQNASLAQQMLDNVDSRYANINPTLSAVAAASRQDFLSYGFGDRNVEL